MKEFGLQLWSVHDFFKTEEDTEKSFRKIASFGYSTVQTAGTYDFISPENFRRYADKAGLRIIGTHYNWDRIKNDIAGTMRYHRILGTCDIGIGGMATPDMESLRAFIADFNRLAAIYHKEGFILTYHNHDEEFSGQFRSYEGKTKFDYLMEELDPECTAFNLDGYWAQVAGMDVRDLIERLHGRLSVFHLKDFEAHHAFSHPDGTTYYAPYYIEVGKGNMNFPGIIRAAEAAGCRHFIVEDERYSTGDPMDSVRMSAEYVKAHLLEH